MGRRIDLADVMFLDIETVPVLESFDNLPEDYKKLWEDKVEKTNKGKEDDEKVTPKEEFDNAGLSSEFGRIVCISVGMVGQNNGHLTLYTKSFYGKNEYRLLAEFAEMLENTVCKHENLHFCGHNSKAFDFPFLCRRMIINGIRIPEFFYEFGKKPWELNWLDTMDMWRFGDSRHFTSLKLLCTLFSIPTPKDDIDGSEVRRVFYEEKNYDRIAIYCEKDVKATAFVFMRMNYNLDTTNFHVESLTFTEK